MFLRLAAQYQDLVKDLVLTLEALAEALPQYTEKDLVVCHRQNDTGA